MADSQSTVALNIGSQRISMAVFDTSKSGGLILKAYESTSLLADPATEVMRMPQTRLAVQELAQRLKIVKGTKIRYAISGQSVLTRFVKLPPLDSDNIDQLVTFEAQQQFPFPLDTVVWDYELLPGAPGEKEVALVAIKSDALDEINSSVVGHGYLTSEIDVAPMALYNAFRVAYADVTEPVLLIDVGAKTSNLLYIEGARFFTRSVPVGGASLTTAIAKEYGISFGEAESQKVSNGIVTLGGGHTSHLDEAVAALGTVIRNALTRLPTEIARTTNHYRSNHGGNAPRRVILAGGGATLPYAKEFLEEKLGLPVEYFNPLRSVAMGKNIDTDTISREAHLLGELVGLALRGTGKSTINIDLVPSSVEALRIAEKRKPWFIASAATVVIGMAAFAFMRNNAASAAEEALSEIKATRDKLAITAVPMENELKNEAKLKATTEAYVASKLNQTFWVSALNEIKTHFASEYVWNVDLEPLHGYDPLKVKPESGQNETNGESLVKEDFATGLGASALVEPRVANSATPTPGPRPNPNLAVAAAPTFNAIRIKGMWRSNAEKQNVVNKLLTSLQSSNSPLFRFSVTNKDATVTEYPKERILLKLQSAKNEEEEYAWPFEIVLPLAREIPSK